VPAYLATHAAHNTNRSAMSMERIYLRQKMAFNVGLIVTFGTAIFVFGIVVVIFKEGFTNQNGGWGFLLKSIILLGPACAYLVYADKGYRISYDDGAIYHRPHGITLKLTYPAEQTLRYEDIEVICGDPGRMINLGIMPFEFIRLYRKDWDGDELFMISPFFLHHEEMKELIWFLYKKRPDAFAQDVIDYLNSDQRL
jgi:hypothetical protein